MSQLVVSDVTVMLGGVPVLRNVSALIGAGERWGIVGRNGSGKTTFLNLLQGRIEPAEGSVRRASGLRMTLLEQQRSHEPDTTVWQAAAQPLAAVFALETSLEEQARALALHGDEDAAAALARYDRDLERFRRADGYSARARVDAVLAGLGFDPGPARTQAASSLSGGELGRLGLAQQLIAPADVLLLDEPTNHLDLDTTAWLEAYLQRLAATVLVVSHDRAFLENTVDHILHFEDGSAQSYTGGFSAFARQHAERRLTQQRAFSAQQRVIEAEEEYIRRNIAGQNSRQAKGRRTRLARLPRLAPPPVEGRTMALRLEPEARGGDQVLVARDVAVRIGARTLLGEFSARVERGEVIGFIGANGTGKSTLLRAIEGTHPLAGGSITTGESIDVACYRQDLAQVPAGRRIFDVIHDVRPLWNRGQVHGHLGRFGFPGEFALRTTDGLSGGERARLALALLVLTHANLLLLDEPTNHLDVESIETLEDALTDFPGTVLLVSHDRALLRALATRIWSLADQRIEDFAGSFDEFLQARAERAARAQDASAATTTRTVDRSAERQRQERERERARRAELRSLRTLHDAAERRVHELETEIAALRTALEDPDLYVSGDGARRSAQLNERLRALERDLGEALGAWEHAALAVEQATSS